MTNVDEPTRIAMLIYPECTALDLVAPHQILASAPNFEVDLIAKSRDPVVTDRRLSLVPDKSFGDAHEAYDIIMVPGATRPHVALDDPETIAFVAKIGANAKYVTSVCTGSLILGAAGLLNGYRATSHWVFKDFLTSFGAIPTEGRVVTDRNRITGGGITAGLDFGLQLAAVLRGNAFAKMMELLFEYDPDPPFGVGSPRNADVETLGRANERAAPYAMLVKDSVERFLRRSKPN